MGGSFHKEFQGHWGHQAACVCTTVDRPTPDPQAPRAHAHLAEGWEGAQGNMSQLTQNKAFRKQHDLMQKILYSAKKWGPRE